jgi:CheY-like chemotaxis protein
VLQQNEFFWEGVTFLIADDDKYCHLLLDRVLRKAGANIFHAYDGGAAIETLSKYGTQINIAIIDLVMPIYDGYQVAEMMRSKCPYTIFVAYSADVLRLESERCRNAGFTRFFSKPMLPYKLMVELNNLLMVKNGL